MSGISPAGRDYGPAAGSSAAAAGRFEEVPFCHPLRVVPSSGTTGLPKPIVRGHGERYRASYYADFPGAWRHGDWIMMLPGGPR
jgi:acyl-coenzyme A synthetase/AMP-(fatty) acid ligase